MGKFLISLALMLIVGLTSFAQIPKHLPNLYTEIYDSSYSFDNLAASYTTGSILPTIGIVTKHLGTFGMFKLKDGKPILRKVVGDKLSTGSGVNGLGFAQAFNINFDGSSSVFSYSNKFDGHFLFDENFNILLNLNDVGIYPDPHGITKLRNGNYAYFQDTFNIVNFASATISDSTNWDALGQNIIIFNPSDSSSYKLFDWFSTIPSSMAVPEYLYEGDQGNDAIDWGHPNSIFEDYDGHLLISWRHIGICKIDKNNGNVIWWAGLPDSIASKSGFNELECVNGDCRTRLQHDLKPIKGKPGYYTLFDNGDSFRPQSRALFFKVEEQNNTIEVVYESFFKPSDFMGSVDVLSNGSYLVNVPSQSDLPPQSVIVGWQNNGVYIDSMSKYLHLLGSDLFLFDSTHNLVAKYWTDSAVYIYNSFFYNYPEWPKVICENHLLVSNTDDLDSFIWYNSNNILLSEEDTLIADSNSYFFTFSKGAMKGFSENIFNASSCVEINNIIDTKRTQSIDIYPNPVLNYLNLSEIVNSYEIINTSGKKVLVGNSTKKIDVSKLVSGIYLINIISNGRGLTYKFIKTEN